MPKPKFLKPLIFGAIGTSLVGLIIGLSINWNHTEYISSVGASGTKPFVESFGKSYHSTHKKIEVAVESGGTTFGVDQLAKGFAQIGNASNNVYNIVNPDKRSAWNDKKTFTLGWEGIVIMYKMPDGLSQNAKDKFDIVITEKNILDLYAVFSCFNETKDGAWKTNDDFYKGVSEAVYKNSMFNYMSKTAKSACNDSDEKIILNTPIFPFVRSGGNTGASISKAFTNQSHLKNFTDLTLNQQNAFNGGQYGNDHAHCETDEANSRVWESFVRQNKPGSMAFITTGFLAVTENRKQMKDKQYKLAGYQPLNSTNPVYMLSDDYCLNKSFDDYINNICKDGTGYNWFRPIDVIIDLNNQKTKNFIYYIFSFDNIDDSKLLSDFVVSEKYESVMRTNGAKPVDAPQFRSMCGVNISNEDAKKIKVVDALFNLSNSDINLEKAREDVKTASKIYGALEGIAEAD